MGSLTNFLANRKPPGINLDQLNLFEGKPVPTGLALMVPIDQLDEDPDNPRKAFPPEAIEELARDIAQRGMLQPIVVSDRNTQGRYLIRFGSRRWRAAIQAGLTTVPVVFAVGARDAYDQVAENLKRQNLSPLELAQFIRRRVDAGESNAEVGRQLGMDLTTVAHHLALLNLPPVLDQALRSGRCESPRTLHELSRLHEEQPEQVAALVAGTEPITREAVTSLRYSTRDVTPAVDKPAPTSPRPDKMAQALARASGLCERLDAALQRLTRSGGIDALPHDQMLALRQRVAELAARLTPETVPVSAETGHGKASA
ncbi:MAG: ParB/RepB/Spo0J family partition protein [Hydrogenophaga sp.]|uniref:ParB/RepB/Spo0J family partition protein n=1 Tax=Hydrogenophaga sp. TaxID=1904254 RepID=UPI00260F861D|nr:ParB/RepB/Spo0J family partition protein [Hydrogenophaga sp.]MCV0440461.1 ParB/RepB/Spo0J family partition protein [Hydrogenophaga sp.]